MAVYTISDLEKLTGIKAHTWRMWEKRYNIIEPKRTKTNIRYYVDEDLKILLNIALLKRSGYKISKIAEMSSEELSTVAMELSSQSPHADDSLQADALSIAMMELNGPKFNALIDQKIQEFGFEHCMNELLFPFLEQLNLLWMTGAVSRVHENFVAGLIKQKICAQIAQLDQSLHVQSKRIMLYLAEQENQELSLYFLHYILLQKGYEVINIGTDISLLDLKKATSIRQPDIILTMLNEGFRQTSMRQYVEDLSLHFRPFTILLTGAAIFQHGIKSDKNVIVCEDIDDILAKMTLSDEDDSTRMTA